MSDTADDVQTDDAPVVAAPEVDVDEVEVWPADEDQGDTARALLSAAEDLDLDPQRTVHSIGPGGFRVPREVAEHAGVPIDDEAPDEKPAKAPAKKAAPTPAAAVAKGAAPGGGDAKN